VREKDTLEKLSSQVSEEELVELTRRLISIPSHFNLPSGEVEVVRALEQVFTAEDIEYELQPVEGERSNIIAKLPGTGGGKSLTLNGHLDTVPPYGMKDPFKAEFINGKIYGRGAVDMKGPIAAMVMAMVAFKRSGIKLKGDLYFAGVIAEETNSEGSETLIESGFRTDGAIIGEPSGREYAIGHRGLEWLEIEIEGKAAHGGIPDKGVNAIVNAAKFIMRVQEKIVPTLKLNDNPVMGPPVMNFGYIEGGTQPSTVADCCRILLDRRYTSQEELSDVLAQYEDILSELEAEDPAFKGRLRRMESALMKKYDHVPMETDRNDPLVKAVVSALEEIVGFSPAMTTSRGWTDAAIFNHYGKMATVVYGPGDITRSHTDHEYITVEELVEGLSVFMLSALLYCNLEDED